MSAPILTFFWIYKGWPFWQSLIATLLIDFVYYSFTLYGFLDGIIAIVIVLVVLWVLSDSKELRVRGGWFFALLTFFLLPIGLIVYLILRRSMSKNKLIKSTEGSIEIRN